MTDNQFKEIQRLKAAIKMHQSKLSVATSKPAKMIQRNAIQKYESMLLSLQNKARED
jgi:hypothetical protein